MRVLLVEDERGLAAAVADGLRDNGMAVDVAPDGGAALAKLDANAYDVVILDRDLPVVHGDVVCRSLSQDPTAPMVLMLTAAAELSDRLDGLQLGADDYLAKPFAFAELVLRVRALARRGRGRAPVFARQDLVMDTLRRAVARSGQPISLSVKEYGVLEVLLAADGGVVSHEELLERVWDEYADPFTNVVAVTVMRLRRKLGQPPLIETVTGGGYRLP
jgi:DNA-binding response OmpR family regulator